MLCAVIKGPSLEMAFQQIEKASTLADLVELRLDFFEVLDLEKIRKLKSLFSIPMLFTLRSSLEGGAFQGHEEERLQRILQLATLQPQYLDLENHIPGIFFDIIASQYPEIKVINSYHNFKKTPEDLLLLYKEMQQKNAHFYKIAVRSESTLDAMRILKLLEQADKKLIAISMGIDGEPSRILGKAFGCPITYASLEECQSSAPGQLTVKTLTDIYRHKSLNSTTHLYGLIGNPVEHSISAETHNAFITNCKLNAAYVKMRIVESDLSDFFSLIKGMPFRGLSVTMPLKEAIFPFVDIVHPSAKEIGAINTLLFEDDKIIGLNTDGMGALNAIEAVMPIAEKKIVILGAGGAARAIAYESCQRGAIVTILNRNAQRARDLAKHFQCYGTGLEAMKSCYEQGYHAIVNCTPISMPIDSTYIDPNAIVMDITTNPKDTLFLLQAHQKGCRIIYGYKMFIEQAIGQFSYWFPNKFQSEEVRKMMEEQAVKILS